MNNINFAPNWKRIGARCTDFGFLLWFLICFYFLILNNVVVGNQENDEIIKSIFLAIGAFLFFVGYFIFIPIWTRGQTLGKKMFAIKLVRQNDKKISFWIYFLREFYIQIVPIIIVIFILSFNRIVVDLFFSDSSQQEENQNRASLLGANFFVFWFVFLFVFQKINENHQLFYDRIFSIYVVNVSKNKTKNKLTDNFLQKKTIPLKETKHFNLLNKEQLRATNISPKKNLLIVAGPGTGKTTVLIYRMSKWITEHEIKPWRILALTFTKKAAKNVRDHLLKLAPGNEKLYKIFTYHAFCYQFLLEEVDRLPNKVKEIVVLDEIDQKNLIKSLILEMDKTNKNKKIDNTTLKQWIFFLEIKQRKLIKKKTKFFEMVNLKLEKENGLQLSEKMLNFIWDLSIKYQEHKRKEGLMDFNDLLIETYNLLIKYPNLLEQWRNRYDTIIIDEFQDTSYLQYRLVELLSNRGKKISVTVIGDPDQTIYGWRDAKIEFILNFTKSFAPAEEINLIQNYRSNQAIISVANDSIKNNQDRLRQKLKVVNKDNEKVHLFWANGRTSQAQEIANQIEKLKENGTPLKEIAILYRSNYLSGFLESFLLQKQISYKIFKGMKFFLRLEIKEMISFLAICVAPKDFYVGTLLTLLEGVGTMTVNKIRQEAAKEQTTIFEFLKTSDLVMIKAASRTKIQEMIKQISTFAKMTKTKETFFNFAKKLFLEIYLPLLKKNYIDEDNRQNNVAILLEIIKNFDNLNSRLSLQEKIFLFLAETKISTDAEYIKDPNSVNLMSIHNAKGLEFENVFVFDVTEGNFPIQKNNISDVSEERRIFFVALTRAKKRLFVFTSIYEPSIFIDEIENNEYIIEQKGYF